MRDESTITIYQVSNSDVITGIFDFFEYTVTALVIPEGLDKITRTDNRLQVMLQGLIKKAFDERLKSVRFETSRLKNLGEAPTSPRNVAKILEAPLENQGFLAPRAMIVKKNQEDRGH